MLLSLLTTAAFAINDGADLSIKTPNYSVEEDTEKEKKTERSESQKSDTEKDKEVKKKDDRPKQSKDKQIKTTKATNEKFEKSKKEKKSSVEQSDTENTMPHIIVGMETGAILNTTDLKAAFLPQWHVGIQFPYWQNRLGLVVHGAYHVSKMEATGTANSLTTGSYSYDIRQQEGEFGFNIRIRIPEVPVVVPEIWLGPTVQLIGTELQGKSGAAFPLVEEQNTRMGLHAALLGEYALPVGSVFGGLHYTYFNFENTIQGAVNSNAFSPMVGYRYRFF